MLRTKVLDVSVLRLLTSRRRNTQNLSVSAPARVFFCLYYICERLFTDGCFDLSMPSGMNDFDTASRITMTITEADVWLAAIDRREMVSMPVAFILCLALQYPPYAILTGSPTRLASKNVVMMQLEINANRASIWPRTFLSSQSSFKLQLPIRP